MYRGLIVDSDVHHTWPRDGDLTPYLPSQWREYALGPGRAGPVSTSIDSGFNNPNGVYRDDSRPPTGGRSGSHYPTLARQVFDDYGASRAVLTYGDGLFLSAIRHPQFVAAVAGAANDYTVEEWLARDQRLMGSITISAQIPELAVAEIRRHAKNPRMVQVIMAGNGVGQPLGHPLFHPIYAATVEAGRPLAVHTFGAGGIMPPSSAGGQPSFYIEYHTHGIQGIMTTLASFITNGVFEKFPSLRLLLLEPGVAWIPGFLWRFDSAYRRLRSETPWVTRAPSEYFHQHVRLTTQPLDSPSRKEDLLAALGAYGADDLMLFATDYPHWDADDAEYVASQLPSAWHEKVFYRNALDFYGWRKSEVTTEPAGARR